MLRDQFLIEENHIVIYGYEKGGSVWVRNERTEVHDFFDSGDRRPFGLLVEIPRQSVKKSLHVVGNLRLRSQSGARNTHTGGFATLNSQGQANQELLNLLRNSGRHVLFVSARTITKIHEDQGKDEQQIRD